MKVGQHFTPDDLVDDLVKKSAVVWGAIAPEKDRSLQICDPACGDGQILKAVQRYCEQNQIPYVLHGYDLDPEAAAACQLALPNATIQVGDFLFDFEIEDYRYDIFVGNPPFLGGEKISGQFGDSYKKSLKENHAGPIGDYCAYFLRESAIWFPRVMSFICTNTISQGRTRRVGLAQLVRHGWVIYAANKSVPWPGKAKVTVSLVHLYEDKLNAFLCLLEAMDVEAHAMLQQIIAEAGSIEEEPDLFYQASEWEEILAFEASLRTNSEHGQEAIKSLRMSLALIKLRHPNLKVKQMLHSDTGWALFDLIWDSEWVSWANIDQIASGGSYLRKYLENETMLANLAGYTVQPDEYVVCFYRTNKGTAQSVI